MKAQWCVLWRGESCAVFLDASGGWSLDPAEARVFEYWAHAKVAGGVGKGVSVVRCWT